MKRLKVFKIKKKAKRDIRYLFYNSINNSLSFDICHDIKPDGELDGEENLFLVVYCKF